MLLDYNRSIYRHKTSCLGLIFGFLTLLTASTAFAKAITRSLMTLVSLLYALYCVANESKIVNIFSGDFKVNCRTIN